MERLWMNHDSTGSPATGRRRPLLALFGFIALIGLVSTLVARAVQETTPAPGASLGERVYVRYCADCHGRDGRGSWRATVFLVRPGDLSDGTQMRTHSDQYLFELIKHGGSPLGKPGMPGFGFHLDETQIRAVVEFVRSLERFPTAGSRGPDQPQAEDSLDPSGVDRESWRSGKWFSRARARYPQWGPSAFERGFTRAILSGGGSQGAAEAPSDYSVVELVDPGCDEALGPLTDE